MNYYNEFDTNKAQWIRNLIAAGHIPPGHVDDRSIKDVTPNDLEGFTQCHFFAGIAGWSLALKLAGWPADRPVWTGSCPCQPFSVAGENRGFDDERDLWPEWFRLISSCRPGVLWGEQVWGKRIGPWLLRLIGDLGGIGYKARATRRRAEDVGAWHGRNRTYFVASNADGLGVSRLEPPANIGASGPWWPSREENLPLVYESPFAPGPCWPQPLLRSVDDGLSQRVVGVHAAGDAIVPQVAAAYIRAMMEAQ